MHCLGFGFKLVFPTAFSNKVEKNKNVDKFEGATGYCNCMCCCCRGKVLQVWRKLWWVKIQNWCSVTDSYWALGRYGGWSFYGGINAWVTLLRSPLIYMLILFIFGIQKIAEHIICLSGLPLCSIPGLFMLLGKLINKSVAKKRLSLNILEADHWIMKLKCL